jgi:hypothetical protein
MAHLWRCETVRLPLLNAPRWVNDISTPLENPYVGPCDKQTLESATEQFASWVLQGPLRLLAKEITDAEEIDKRHRSLVLLLTDAAELAIELFCADRYFILHGLDKFGLHKNIKQDRTYGLFTTTLTAHPSHVIEDGDDRLDGRPPVILIQPALVTCPGANSDPRLCHEQIIHPGLAVIEDREAN